MKGSWKMMNINNPGTIAGLIIGVIVCAIFAFVIMKLAKKESANLEEILKAIPAEYKEQLKNVAFDPAEGKNMFTSKALVADVKTENDKSKARLIFWAPEHAEFFDRNVKVTAEEISSKNISKLSFIPVLMKYDPEMHFHDFKKIL